jgi:hypothetical protein
MHVDQCSAESCCGMPAHALLEPGPEHGLLLGLLVRLQQPRMRQVQRTSTFVTTFASVAGLRLVAYVKASST